MSMTMEQVVTQFNKKLFHVESSSGSRIWTCRCSASNQQSCDSSSLGRILRVSSTVKNDLGRPKEFTGP